MSYCQLSSEERYVISYLVLDDLSLREIGRRIGRHHSTISREIKRNRPTYADDAVYWYDAAQQYETFAQLLKNRPFDQYSRKCAVLLQ